MKCRTFPVVSFLAVFPALTFAGSSADLSERQENRQDEPFAAGFARKGVHLPEHAPVLKGSLSVPLPVPQQIQKAELPEFFKGMSAVVTRYSNGRQKLSFELSDDNSQTLQSQQPASDYLKILLNIIEVVAYKGVEFWYDEKTSSFELSYGQGAIGSFNIQVRSRVRTDNNPEGTLSGFAALDKTTLTDSFAALSCYAGMESAFFYGTIACGDGRYLSENGSKHSYSYSITSSAPLQTALFSEYNEQQFGVYKGRPLSDDLYFLLTLNGKPVKVAAIGDIHNTDEVTDVGGNDTGSKGKSPTRESNQKRKSQSGLDHTGTSPQKRGAAGGQGGGDDPKRPSDYKPKPPRDSADQAVESGNRNTRKLQRKLDEVTSKIDRIKGEIDTKWGGKGGLNDAEKSRSKIAQVRELEIEQEELSRKLEQKRSELAQQSEQANRGESQEPGSLKPAKKKGRNHWPKQQEERHFRYDIAMHTSPDADYSGSGTDDSDSEEENITEQERRPHTRLVDYLPHGLQTSSDSETDTHPPEDKSNELMKTDENFPPLSENEPIERLVTEDGSFSSEDESNERLITEEGSFPAEGTPNDGPNTEEDVLSSENLVRDPEFKQ